MENMSNIGNLFALSHDAVIYVENGIIAYLNPPAITLFGRDKLGMPEQVLLPESLLSIAQDDFVASAKISDTVMTVCRSNFAGHRLYSFFPGSAEEDRMAIHAVSATMRELTNGIKTTSDLIADLSVQYEDDRLQKYSAVLKHNSAKMKRLVNNYSMFSAFKTSTQPFHPQMTSMEELITEIVREVSQYSLPHNIRITYAQTENVICSVDRELLQQLLTNLISNSLSSMENGGDIRIELRPAKTYLVLSVADTGCGIPPDVLVNVFKGYRTNVNLSGGMFSAGLGLSVADAIAKRHGGTMLIESKPDKGTKVTIQIPKVVDKCLKACKPVYKVPMKEFIMTDLSTWLEWEDFLYHDKRDFDRRQARKIEKLHNKNGS